MEKFNCLLSKEEINCMSKTLRGFWIHLTTLSVVLQFQFALIFSTVKIKHFWGTKSEDICSKASKSFRKFNYLDFLESYKAGFSKSDLFIYFLFVCFLFREDFIYLAAFTKVLLYCWLFFSCLHLGKFRNLIFHKSRTIWFKKDFT